EGGCLIGGRRGRTRRSADDRRPGRQAGALQERPAAQIAHLNPPVSLQRSFAVQAFSVRTRYARGVRDPDDWFGGAAQEDGAEGLPRTEGDEEDWLNDAERP